MANGDPEFEKKTVSFAVIGKSLEADEIKEIQNKIGKLGYENVKVQVLNIFSDNKFEIGRESCPRQIIKIERNVGV